MSYQLFLQTAAVNDLREAFEWYESQKLGLGDELLSAVDEVLALLEQNPMLFALVYRQKRRAALRRFPYNIIYSIEGDTIRVSAIVHGKQDPAHWHGRP